MAHWAKVPLRWIRQGEVVRKLRPNGPGDLGLKVSALKVYLAIATGAGAPGQSGEVCLSYSELEDAADVSRPMIRPALDLLIDLVDIKVGVGSASSTYRVRGFPPGGGGWAKLPVRVMEKLDHFSPRLRVSLDALLVYLVILAFRDNASDSATVSRHTIGRYTDIRAKAISRAVSVLLEAQLISVSREREDELSESEPSCYRYAVLGLGQKKVHRIAA